MNLTNKYSLGKINEILSAATDPGSYTFEFNGPYVEWTYHIPEERRIGIPSEEPAVVEAGIHYMVFDPSTQHWIAYRGPSND